MSVEAMATELLQPHFNNPLRELNPVNEISVDAMATEVLQLPCFAPGWVPVYSTDIDTNPSYVLEGDRVYTNL